MKRYAIVRVEHYCPIVEDNNGDLKQTPYCPQDKDKNFLCSDCKMLKNYGDTKEQLVRKIAQALLIDQIERYRKAPNCDVNKTIIEHEYRICLEKARKIVKFLGVEE